MEWLQTKIIIKWRIASAINNQGNEVLFWNVHSSPFHNQIQVLLFFFSSQIWSYIMYIRVYDYSSTKVLYSNSELQCTCTSMVCTIEFTNRGSIWDGVTLTCRIGYFTWYSTIQVKPLQGTYTHPFPVHSATLNIQAWLTDACIHFWYTCISFLTNEIYNKTT